MASIQNGIKEYLSNAVRLDGAFGGQRRTSVKSPVGTLQLPIIKSHFLCGIRIGDSALIDVLFLKSFNIPEFGINFNTTEDQLGFPIPSLIIGQISLEGYLMKDSVRDLTALYNSQFAKGLLSMKSAPDITIFKLVLKEDNDVDVPVLASATAAMNAILMGATGDIKALGNLAAAAYDIKEDTITTIANSFMDESCVALYTFEKCRFSAPSIQIDQTSNDFASVALKANYRSVVTHNVDDRYLFEI